ncbi:NAD(P)/FAD-dependent oxidoreductase [Roseovarius sp. S4756]|uniref:NAD(P)/FAD-dependent oxidoreductase n=1 Tax=Roseovarius maritimus TaxID=3342637 RepID=UPI003728AE68
MTANLPKHCEIVIIGAGIQGLLLAFNLLERGKRDILVLDAGYWQGGASGRNGTLVRSGFSSPEWIGLFHHSVEQWKGLSARLGRNVMYTRRGYSVIGESEKTRAMLDTAHKNQKAAGVNSELLSQKRLQQVLPAIKHRNVTGAIHLKDGGTAPHHAVMKAALDVVRARGIQVHYQTAVTGLETSAGRVSAVLVGDQRIEADLTVIAAGGQSTDLAQMAGVDIEAMPFRIEAAATEPLRPLIYPAIALVDRMTYLHQTARGEIVGGSELPGESAKRNLKSTPYVLPRYCKHLLETFPQLRNLRILRQWSGYLHPAPDGGPLLGPHPDIGDLWLSAGWTYGIAGGPGAADLMAKAIATGDIDSRMAAFSVDRFRRGKPCMEASAVIDNASAAT